MQVHIRLRDDGRLLLPRALRDALWIDDGDWLRVTATGAGTALVEPVTADVLDRYAAADRTPDDP